MRSLFRSAEQATARIRVEIHFPPALFYALVHNDVPVASDLRVENLTEEDLGTIEVAVQLAGPRGALSQPWTRHARGLAASSSHWWDDFRDLTPDAAALRAADEAFPVNYGVTVLVDGVTELEFSAASRALAHNEWLNAPSLYESIAAFVQPNAASVGRVLRSAARLLERDTGSGSLQAYQAGPKRAAHIGAAIYEALRAEAITYVALPASFEETGQKVRTTAGVLRDRLGNCIDLSVTYAACLEAAGLHPLIWIIEEHAFAGFFLHDDRLPESVSLEPNHLINIVESGKALPVELTGIGPGESSLPFDQAVQQGLAHLRSGAELLGMVDIHLAHKSGIRAMPSGDGTLEEPAAATAATAPHRITDLPASLLRSGAFDEEENLELRAAEDDAPPRIHAWRRSLLDLSLRNPLLKLPKTGKGLDLHVPGGALPVLDDLVHDGKAIRIVPQDQVSGVQRLKGVSRAQDLDSDVLADELRTDRRVYGAVTEQSYVGKMRGLQRDARTLEQETGSNYLYLTLGTLVHPTPSGEARAPLFLLPVRIEGGTGRKPYTVLIDGDELAAPNWCLIQWLKVKHGVRIPVLENPITDDSGIDIHKSFAAIRTALIDSNLDYRIDESASLRLLQFSTFQMWRDLTRHWETILANPVVEHLVTRPGEPFADPMGDEELTFDEAALQLPIPADGSQMRAIAMAEQGRSFVLEGPPGTGKSQTITNLIAHAIQSGKTVLFVAEKQAALEVVKRRLKDIGLENFCLDLHGRKQSVRSIRQQLDAARNHAVTADEHGWLALQARYRAQLSALQQYPGRLHAENGAGYSYWSAYQGMLALKDGARAEIPASYFSVPPPTREAVTQMAAELPTVAQSAQLRPAHPWALSNRRTVHGLDAQAVTEAADQLERSRLDFQRFPDLLREAIAVLPAPEELTNALACAQLAASGQLPTYAQTVASKQPGWDAQVAAVRAGFDHFRAQHASTLTAFRHDAFVSPSFDEWSTAAAAAQQGLFGRKKRRAALAEALRPYATADTVLDERTVLGLFAGMSAARQAAAVVVEQARAIPNFCLAPDWLPTRPDAVELWDQAVHATTIARALVDRHPGLWRAFLTLGAQVPVSDLMRLTMAWAQWTRALDVTASTTALWRGDLSWAAAWDRDSATWLKDVQSFGLTPIQRWGTLLSHTDVCAQAGLDAFRNQVLSGHFEPADLEVCFLRGVAHAALAERARAHDLEYFDGATHDLHVDQYLALGRQLREQLPHQLAAGVVRRRPIGITSRRSEAGELIRRLNSRNDRLSFRNAVKTYPKALIELTPCFLMSPASVANFLEPGALTFDMVVFDEASQIRVAQAVGAMGRARSVVVVGDSKQMPPTSVMEANSSGNEPEDGSAVVEDLDSILSECVESGLPQEWLSWHYRSTDESLIAFSNDRYYDGKLATLPAPGTNPTTGITWRRVDGKFDRGTRASRTNRIEAAAIVDEVSAILHAPSTADRSIGVVTFNVQQRDLLLNLLEDSTDERIQDALTRQDGEALFVKNLENVQGDERDVVLFSLAFSKDQKSGILPLNFGPLSLTGGERRLNVAITRARKQVVLFSSFDPADIDLARTNAVGTKHLRAYLEMAGRGVERSTAVSTERMEEIDRVLDEVATVLTDRGHEVKKHHGLSHFTVDLAVRAPGAQRWQVAVMLDGPQWSSRPTVADREGAPQLLRTVMGWPSVVRIWLPTWLTDRETILKRIDAGISAPEYHTETSAEHLAAAEPAPIREREAEPAKVALLASATPAHSQVEVPRADTRPGLAADPMPSGVLGVPFVAYEPRPVGTRDEFARISTDRAVRERLQDAFAEVIGAEGPIEEERLVRKVVQCFGWERVRGIRRDEALRFVPKSFTRKKSRFGTFYWPHELDPDTWVGYRTTQSSTDRSFAEIAPEEIVNAMRAALDTGASTTAEALERATLERLGYVRRTANIESILNKAATFGMTTGRLPRGLSEDGTSADHVVAPEERVEAPAVAGPAERGSRSVVDEIDGWLGLLDDRALTVLTNRYFAQEPETLEEIGDRFGLMRDRVRSIEQTAKQTLLRQLADSAQVSGLLAQLRAEIQPVAELDRLIAQHPVIAEEVGRAKAPLWLVLDKFDDFFEVVDGWAVAPSVEATQERTALLLSDLADEYGVVPLSALGPVVDEFGMGEAELRGWLEWCGYDLLRGHVLTRQKSFADRAAAILSIVGEPLSIGDIAAELGAAAPPGVAATRLESDDRFTTVNGTAWALSAWQRDGRSFVIGEIGKIVDIAGSVPLSELIGQIRAHFRGISEARIEALASEHPFEIRNGRVRRSSQAAAQPKKPEDTERLFRKNTAWLLRIRVTHDHLRGSGFALPAPLAKAVGVGQGGHAEFHSRLGLRSVRWTGVQAMCTPIRQFLEQAEVGVGAVVFLKFSDEGEFDVIIPQRPMPEDDPLAKALWLTGRSEGSVQNAQRQLSAAIRLPADADRRTVIDAYRARGDAEIVESLEEAWGQ